MSFSTVSTVESLLPQGTCRWWDHPDGGLLWVEERAKPHTVGSRCDIEENLSRALNSPFAEHVISPQTTFDETLKVLLREVQFLSHRSDYRLGELLRAFPGMRHLAYEILRASVGEVKENMLT